MGMEFRPYYLSKSLNKMGHHVTIVASSFTHLRVSQPVILGSLTSQEVDGLHYFWIKCFRYVGNGIGRLMNISQFIFGLMYHRKKLLADARPDVVIASSTYPMDIWPARYLAKLCGARLVFELHDVWPQSLTEIAGLSKWHPMVMIAGMAEKAAYRSANSIVSMLPAIHHHCVVMGFDTSRLSIIPNGIVDDDWHLDEPSSLPVEIVQAIFEMRAKKHLIICYAGAHGEPNALENLINAAELLQNKRFSFLLVGNGNIRVDLERMIKVRELGNIAMFKGIPKGLIPTMLRMVDVGFIGAKDRPIYRHGISPNKIVDYMMAEIPIICAIKAGNDPVKNAECGVTVEPNNSEALASVISHLDTIGHAKREAMGRRGKEFVMKNYTYDVLAEKFIMALK
jgi:glycosyltransferase involved in cell wall biosynthesis